MTLHYRITIEEDASGRRFFYPQKRVLFFFWSGLLVSHAGSRPSASTWEEAVEAVKRNFKGRTVAHHHITMGENSTGEDK